jgi:hypothetical protein
VVHQVTTDNTFVWTPSTGTYPEISLTCLSRKSAEVDCVAGNVRTAFVQPLAPLVSGETYEAVVNPAVDSVLVVDRSRNPAPTSTQGFAPSTEVEQDSAAISYGWRTLAKRGALGGSYVVDHRAGARVSFGSSGRRVTWYTATGPAREEPPCRSTGTREARSISTRRTWGSGSPRRSAGSSPERIRSWFG